MRCSFAQSSVMLCFVFVGKELTQELELCRRNGSQYEMSSVEKSLRARSFVIRSGKKPKLIGIHFFGFTSNKLNWSLKIFCFKVPIFNQSILTFSPAALKKYYYDHKRRQFYISKVKSFIFSTRFPLDFFPPSLACDVNLENVSLNFSFASSNFFF